MSFADALKRDRPGRIHDTIGIVEKKKLPRISFDVEKAIPEETWEGMEEMLRKIVDGYFGNSFFRRISFLKDMFLLRPEKDRTTELSRLPQSLLIEEWQNRRLATERFALMQICGEPYTLSRDRSDLANELWQYEKNQYEMEKDRLTYNAALDCAERLFFIDPERTRREIILDDRWWKKFADWLRRAGAVNYYQYRLQLRHLKFIAPERLEEFDIASSWHHFEDDLEWYHSHQEKDTWDEYWDHYVTSAANMKIIAADDVRMTDHGLEVVTRREEAHREPIPPRPIRPKFV